MKEFWGAKLDTTLKINQIIRSYDQSEFVKVYLSGNFFREARFFTKDYFSGKTMALLRKLDFAKYFFKVL
jgi:hypothetical protein